MSNNPRPKNPGERNRDRSKKDLGNPLLPPSPHRKKKDDRLNRISKSDSPADESKEAAEIPQFSPFAESVRTTNRFDASTHVDQMTRVESLNRERAVLVGVYPPKAELSNDPLEELAGLAETARVETVGRLIQRRERPDFATCIGKGKVEELGVMIETSGANVVLFDNDLAPGQTRNLEQALKVKVIDRTELILDIFASRAQTHEARLAVELAQLEYAMPRLKRMWTHLERQAGGGVGLRGPGEKQLEVDRRIAQKKISALKGELDEIHARKRRQISGRRWSRKVCLVGYTNTGKSTLLNRMTDSDVFVKDLLFATLDTRTRRWFLPGWGPVLLSDTVGFIRDLPHHLIASFRATLAEATGADLLLHVADAGNPDVNAQIKSAVEVLESLGIDEKDTILVLNKIDRVEPERLLALKERYPMAVCVSARDGSGLDDLTCAVNELLSRGFMTVEVEAPIADGRLDAYLTREGEVLARNYDEDAATAVYNCRLPKHIVDKLSSRTGITLRGVPPKEDERRMIERGTRQIG
ncbi:MAG: GTPase HflX [Thermoguttaceae bacterium]|jgi:GTP-binding protein HflX